MIRIILQHLDRRSCVFDIAMLLCSSTCKRWNVEIQNSFSVFIAEMVLSKVLVIDGGFATQLTVHVGKSVDGDQLWSAR